MCEHTSTQDSISFPLSGKPRLAITGSRRRRLWELPNDCHCPVIGVCLPMPVLRKALNKLLSTQVALNDYDLHVGAVSLCAQRSPVSEKLQSELDRRYATAITRFKTAKSSDALARLWSEAIEQGEVAGALWATLTHPCCDVTLHENICRDIHMIQHQAGACTRADIVRQAQTLKKCQALELELERLQRHYTQALAEKNAEVAVLRTAFMKGQAVRVGKDTAIFALQQQLDELQAAIPDLEPRARLKEKNAELAQRQQALRAENDMLKQRLAELQIRYDAIANHGNDAALAEVHEAVELTEAQPIHLHEKKVLCVGGRTGSIAAYRKMIEDIGGKFAHHDGGVEDSANLLDASLAAADLVICQAGCIAHNAYWRVKEHCKRTGKQCVFVDNPSASGLARGLRHISIEVLGARD